MKKVSYFYNQEVGKYYYGKDHPMKPKRVAMAHTLINNLGLYKQLDVYTARYATEQEIMQFHDPSYVSYLKNHVNPDTKKLKDELGLPGQEEDEIYDKKFNIHNPKTKLNLNQGESSDCPSFEGLYNFCQISAGGSIDAANLVINQKTDIAINWAGGLHHAKKMEASGFCYVNDIVLCILELLKFYPRVIYIDVDVHHGDGVEEAFYLTNRVMTVSYHQYGDDFFPGSGNLDSIGDGEGKYHSINIPLKPGINDEQFERLFEETMTKIMESYRPYVIVLQSGADSLAHDKLGHFNLSTKGHGKCLTHMMKYGLPIILLGGGGYTVANVSRCWAYETSLALGQNFDIQTQIPTTDPFYEYYTDHKLHVTPKNNMENKNSKEDIEKIKTQIYSYLKEIESAPGFQIHYSPELIKLHSDTNNLYFDEQDNEQYHNFNPNRDSIIVQKYESQPNQTQKASHI